MILKEVFHMQNDVKHELGTNFIEYAVAVNTDRAIPDAKSGLKPVAKRILWSAFEEGRLFSKPHVKAARIVGDVMGKYHPHGDSSIYGAMTRLSQNWVMRYPLIDWHGSNGNIAGDGAAAMRYTEARLSKLAEDGMLAGIKKKNVNFTVNFDETLEEPVTLPAIFPNLLCNPNTGIGVAMACNWLPHNLNEVAQAIYDYMDDKEVILPGPDFPTGGIIINKNDIPSIMKTGHGSVKVRGKYKLEKQNIVFYEIPYGTTIEGLLTEIGKACDEKEIEGISEIRDESNKKGIRIVIECEKSVNPDSIVMKLYNKTNLQTSISYNQVALIDKTPTELNLIDCIKIYIEHNIDCIQREATFDLEKATDRLEIVNGLIKALEDIDNIIVLIKKSESATAAKEALISKYQFTENQAKAILAMRLSSLARLEKIELNKEKEELETKVKDLKDIISSKSRKETILRERLQSLVKKYGDTRRTELAQIEIPKEEKEIAEVIPEDVVVIMSQSGDIKRIPAKSFKVQRKNGKGVKTEDDAILGTISTNTIDNLMLFTSKGKMYRLLVDNIPIGTNISKGIRVNTLINMEADEKVIAITSLHRQSEAEYVVFFTKKGLIKKTKLEEYTKVKRSTGIAAINIKDGDSLANVTFLNDEEVVIITRNGMAIHFPTVDIAPIGRITAGVKSIKLTDDDEVVVGLPIHKNTDLVAIFTSNGYAKKCNLEEFPFQLRGGKGVSAYKPSNITGNIIGAEMIDDNDNILLVGKPGSICISSKDIPLLSRVSIGNIMLKGTVNSVVKL
jgi:DNA gyrase subunit A